MGNTIIEAGAALASARAALAEAARSLAEVEGAIIQARELEYSALERLINFKVEAEAAPLAEVIELVERRAGARGAIFAARSLAEVIGAEAVREFAEYYLSGELAGAIISDLSEPVEAARRSPSSPARSSGEALKYLIYAGAPASIILEALNTYSIIKIQSSE